MITYAQLKSIAAKNGCKVEVNTIYGKPYDCPGIDENGKVVWRTIRVQLGFEIGVRNLYGRKGKSEWQWFWFETLSTPETLEEETRLIFKHRYSQLTGNYNRGLWERINACNYIENNAF